MNLFLGEWQHFYFIIEESYNLIVKHRELNLEVHRANKNSTKEIESFELIYKPFC